VRYRTVLFDLDGTLIDSGPIILASMRHATRTVLNREVPDDVLLAGVGSGLVAEMHALDPGRADELVRAYREHNEPLHQELQACDGVLAALAALRSQGRTLGVVSAKRRRTIAMAFDFVPLAGYFEVVVGADDTELHKPHPDPLLHALERLGADPGTAAYVGDAPFDVQSARSAGIAAIAVTWGRIHSRERLALEQPDAIVDSVEELLGVL
jgi:pyrophosphatase PpaX